MEVEIRQTSDNKLLERKEIEATVSFDGATPARKDLRDAIGRKIGANPDLLVLRKVENEYGRKRVKVSVHSYESEDTLRKGEPEHMLKRMGIGEKKEEKPEEAGKEAPAAEKTPEKEGTKAEEKKEAPAEEKAPEKKEAAPEKPAEEKK